MSFILTEEQALLRDTARQFFQEQVPTSNLRALRDNDNADGYDKAVWQQIVALGFSGILIPEAYGGSAFGAKGMGLVMQEAGRTLAASPLYATAILGASLILDGGSEAQKKAILPKIASGETLLASAIDEAAHHAPHQIALTAKKSAKGYTLNGDKVFVIDGHIADTLIIAARTSGKAGETKGISLFLAPAAMKGITRTRTRTQMVDSRNAANISFKNVALPQDALLGAADGGHAILENALDIARICLAAEMLGGIESVFETTLAYLKERKQFGAIIGTFQALKHRAADMFCEVEIAQAVVMDALSALEERRNDIPRAASLAKARLADAARLITNEGVQMHGGIGMTDEVDMGLYIKRARVQAQIFGDAHFHRNRYAALGGY